MGHGGWQWLNWLGTGQWQIAAKVRATCHATHFKHTPSLRAHTQNLPFNNQRQSTTTTQRKGMPIIFILCVAAGFVGGCAMVAGWGALSTQAKRMVSPVPLSALGDKGSVSVS